MPRRSLRPAIIDHAGRVGPTLRFEASKRPIGLCSERSLAPRPFGEQRVDLRSAVLAEHLLPRWEPLSGTRRLICAIGPRGFPSPERHARESPTSGRTSQVCPDSSGAAHPAGVTETLTVVRGRLQWALTMVGFTHTDYEVLTDNAQDDVPDWDLLGEFARRRDELDPFLLRSLLASSLRRRGFAAIVWSEDAGEGEPPASRAPTIAALLVVWSLGVSATSAVGLPWFVVPVALLAVSLTLAILATLTSESGTGGLVLLAWVTVGLVVAVEGTFLTLLAAYLLPLGLGLVYAIASRLLRLRDAQDVAMALAGVIKSAPLVAPVVLIVLFLPALSSDVWRVAGELSAGSLLVVGIVSVGLLFGVVRLQLGSQVGPMIAQRAEHLSNLAARSELTRRQIAVTIDESGTAVLDGMSDSRLDAAWPTAGEEYAPYLRAAVGETLAAPLTGRLAITVVVIGVLFSGYIYVLCAAVVPVEVASEWTAVATPTTTVEVLGASGTLSGGPYLNLAALLGLAATATFLSFALVEARFAQALTDALLRDPTDRFLGLALPYVKLWEDAIEAGRRRQLGKDPA